MNHPNRRLDTSEDAMAYHVASLLRQPSHSNTRDIDTHSLRSMTSQIEQFLFMAPQVPAVRMEPAWTASGDNDEGERGAPERGGQPVVELNVVAGVLEACDAAALNGGMTTLTGVLLPTAENQRELHRRKVEQAQAMLNLISALTPSPEAAHSSYGASRESGPSSQEAAQVSPNLSTRVLRHFSSSDSDDGEVAVMDADDLNDEDTSDDDMPAQRRRIQEMN